MEVARPRDVMPELRMSEALDFTPQLPEPSTVKTPVGQVLRQRHVESVLKPDDQDGQTSSLPAVTKALHAHGLSDAVLTPPDTGGCGLLL